MKACFLDVCEIWHVFVAHLGSERHCCPIIDWIQGAPCAGPVYSATAFPPRRHRVHRRRQRPAPLAAPFPPSRPDARAAAPCRAASGRAVTSRPPVCLPRGAALAVTSAQHHDQTRSNSVQTWDTMQPCNARCTRATHLRYHRRQRYSGEK